MLNPKSQIPNPKQIINSKIQNSKWKSFGHWLLGYWVLFGIWCLVIGISTYAYALNLDKLKVYFLEGDYKQAILEGEKILASSGHTSGLDELYYILGLSYLKDGNFLRASDIFQIILEEFKDSKFKEEAKLALADTYFLSGDLSQAQACYKELISSKPATKLKADISSRLSQMEDKKADTDIYYTVQVGSFAKSTNARNLCQKLIQNGYAAYVQEVKLDGKKVYRVKVGRLKLLQDANQLKNKLSSEGYPTKLCP